MPKVNLLTKRIAGWALSVLLSIWAALKFLMDWVGRSTAPEDFQQLREKLPDMLEWLYQTPWQVPAILAAGVSGVVIWLNRPQYRILEAKDAEAQGLISSDHKALSAPRQSARLRLHYRENDATPDMLEQQNIHRWYSLSFLQVSQKDGQELTSARTVTVLWVMYDKPVSDPNRRIRVPEGTIYEIKDAGSRHAIVVFPRIPSNTTVELETY